MSNRSFEIAVRRAVFRDVSARMDAVHSPGTPFASVVELLNPLEISMDIARGADGCADAYPRVTQGSIARALGQYVSDTEEDARALASDWVDVTEQLVANAERPIVTRLGSHEAEVGKVIVQRLLEDQVPHLMSGFLGRMLGALAGMSVEEARLALAVRRLDQRYEPFISEMRPRFDSTVMPYLV